MNNSRNYSPYFPEELSNDLNFNVELPTLLYIFGFNEHLEADNTKTIVDSYLIRNDHNIFILDWSTYNQKNYVINAAPHAISIGIFMGKMLINWFLGKGVFSIEKFHLMGHSLGIIV